MTAGSFIKTMKTFLQIYIAQQKRFVNFIFAKILFQVFFCVHADNNQTLQKTVNSMLMIDNLHNTVRNIKMLTYYYTHMIFLEFKREKKNYKNLFRALIQCFIFDVAFIFNFYGFHFMFSAIIRIVLIENHKIASLQFN